MGCVVRGAEINALFVRRTRMMTDELLVPTARATDSFGKTSIVMIEENE